MPTRIRSLLASGPVTVPLNTGAVVRLSPGQLSDELQDVEVAGNAKVEKLRQQRVIAVETTKKSSDPAPASATAGSAADAAADDAAGTGRSTRRGH
jgi:hypothetical protein